MTEPRHLAPVNEPFNVGIVPPPPATSTVAESFTGPSVDDYEFVRLPNGVIHPVLKSSIQEVPETATQAIPKTALVEVVDPHFYVWLANGDVIRVKQSDLPATAGTNAQFGHWQIENKVFQIVNVVPVEDIVKGDQA